MEIQEFPKKDHIQEMNKSNSEKWIQIPIMDHIPIMDQITIMDWILKMDRIPRMNQTP